MEKHETGESERRFEGKVALVTGAGSGIGRAAAERFSREGGKVVLFGRTRDKLEEVARSLPAASTLVAAGNHQHAGDVEACVGRALDRFQRLDLLFNNAGTYNRGDVAGTSESVWAEALANNLTGPFLMSRQVLPAMRDQGAGTIINNASTLGIKPIPGAAPYCVAKAALIMLTRSTALEEARHGIRACAICPGVVDTPIHGADPATRSQFLDTVGPMHPIGRIGTADEVAALVLFLASDASSWTTGAVIHIDGGISLT